MQRERRTIWSMVRMMLWALSAVALVACIREDLIDDPDDPDAPENVVEAGNYDLYFQIQYDAAPETRVSGSSGEDSGSLENGSHDEHEIGRTGNFVLLFFANPDTGKQGDEAYVLRDLLPLTLEERWSDSDKEEDLEEGSTATPEAPDMPEIPDRDPDKEKVETIFRSRINVDPKDLPRKCLVILNGTPFYERLVRLRNDRATLKEVLEMTWDNAENPRLIGRDGNRFVMTNAAYEVEEVDAEGKVVGKKLQIATDLGDMKNLRQYLFIEGERNRRKKALRIYVERMVAKFTLKIEETMTGASGCTIVRDIRNGNDTTYIFTPPTKNYETGKAPFEEYKDLKTDEVLVFTGFDENGIQKVAKRKWRARVTGWGVNALETSSYLFKNLPVMQDFNIGESWNWNDADNHRSYWAKDPHYSSALIADKWTNKYPWQYRDAVDRSHPEWAEKMPRNYEARMKESEDSGEKPILENQTFEYFSNDMAIDRTVYVPENTYDFYASTNDELYEEMLDKREHLLAGTHMVVCAELEIAGPDGKYRKFTGYRDRVGTYYWGKLNPNGMGTETWENTEMAPYSAGDYELQNNTRNCFIRLMRTFNYYLGSQQEMYFVYYDWSAEAIGSGWVTSHEPNLGKSFYAKPRTTNKSHGGIYDDEENTYEICWEEKGADDNVVVYRMFSRNNNYLLGNTSETTGASIDHDFKFFDMAYVKDGDGKVLPWVDGLRIFRIANERDHILSSDDVAQIPVHDKSNAQIATDVQSYVNKLKVLVERKMANPDDEIDLKEEADKGEWDLSWGATETALNWSWVKTKTDEEVYLAQHRELYEQDLLDGKYPGVLQVEKVDVNERRSMLLDWLNTVDYFEEGMMYYAAEVKNPLEEGKYAYRDSPYGVVRNNWYQFNLMGITSIGTSIAEHKEHIVPNRVSTNDQMTFNVKVLNWKDVPMGSITLPK